MKTVLNEVKQSSKYIDHTNIKKEALTKDIIKTCQEAKKYNFRGVCVNPEWVRLVKQELKGTDIKVVVLIDGPMGLLSHQRRMEICRQSIEDGADELDVVLNIVDLKYEKYDQILDDLKEICALKDSKIIIGSGYLTDEEIVKGSCLVKQAGAICVKTATFKDPLEYRELNEKLKHLELMRQGAPSLLIKISGRINTYKDFKRAIKAGADIVGTSSGKEIMKEMQNETRIR